MKVIVCIDDNGGMLFNKRRQSRDRKVLEDIAGMNQQIRIHSFSEKLFAESERAVSYLVDDEFLSNAGVGEYCFVEHLSLAPYLDKIEEVIVYHWNRKYPTDFRLDLPYKTWKKQSKEEFAGYSHEKITKERYKNID